MNDDTKTALSIGLVTVYLGHAVLEKKISDRMKQIGAGTIGAGAYYLTSEAINRSDKLNNRKVLRNILEATAAVVGAYAGARVGSYIQKVIGDYKSRKNQLLSREDESELEMRGKARKEEGIGRNEKIIKSGSIDRLIDEQEGERRSASPFLRTYKIIRLEDYQMIKDQNKESELFSDNIMGVRYK